VLAQLKSLGAHPLEDQLHSLDALLPGAALLAQVVVETGQFQYLSHPGEKPQQVVPPPLLYALKTW
jgi:hypothetical protein